MAKMLHETLKTIEHYKQTSPHYEELLDILGEILILREKFQKEMVQEVFPVDERLIAHKITGGLPLIDLVGGQFDLSEPKRYFLSLLKIVGTHAPEEAEEVMQKLTDGTLDFNEMIQGSLLAEEDSAADTEEEESFDLVALFVEESLRPALAKVVEKYGESVSRLEWAEGYCPICGRDPKIGEIREEEGHRYLFCHQCGFQWVFLRIKCPFCGNEEQQSLAYFTIEGDERYRVDVCNECKRYIKIVDFREAQEEANLDVEDIATLHLDILANEEGYN